MEGELFLLNIQHTENNYYYYHYYFIIIMVVWVGLQRVIIAFPGILTFWYNFFFLFQLSRK